MPLNSLTVESLSLSHSPLLGVLVLVALYLVTVRITTGKARQKIIKQFGCKAPIRYPSRDPFFGIDTIYEAICALNSKNFLSQKLVHYERYGSTFSSRLSTFSVISTIEPENIKTVLSAAFKDYVVGAARRNAFSPVLRKSIFIFDGPEWEHSRAFLRPCFTRSQVADLATLEVHVGNLIRAIPCDGSTVDLGDLFLRYTADVTTDFMFGQSIQSLPQPESFQADLMQAFRDVQTEGERRFRLGSFANFVPQPTFHQAARKVHAYMDTHVVRAIETRHLQQKQQQQSSDDGAQDVKKYIFLHELVKQTDDRQTLRDELLGIFLAGRDTTSALLSNLFFVLARSPRIWQRLCGEIEELGGMRPTLDQLKSLKYLGFCLNETLRLYPVVPGTSRVAAKDTVLPEGGGADGKSPVFVPVGTLVIFHFFALHQRKDLWGPDASEFRPERWQNETASWKFLPFGGGPRNCIGQQFALIEASYTAVRLIQEFSAVVSRDSEPWTESIGASCSSANGVKVAMTRR